MSYIIHRIEQLLCGHPTEVHRMRDGRWFLECLSCGRETPGVEVSV